MLAVNSYSFSWPLASLSSVALLWQLKGMWLLRWLLLSAVTLGLWRGGP